MNLSNFDKNNKINLTNRQMLLLISKLCSYNFSHHW